MPRAVHWSLNGILCWDLVTHSLMNALAIMDVHSPGPKAISDDPTYFWQKADGFVCLFICLFKQAVGVRAGAGSVLQGGVAAAANSWVRASRVWTEGSKWLQKGSVGRVWWQKCHSALPGVTVFAFLKTPTLVKNKAQGRGGGACEFWCHLETLLKNTG